VTGAVLMIDIPEGNSMHEGMSIADVDAWMTDLRNAGVLSKINALVISRPYRYSAEDIVELKQVIDRVTYDLEIPVLFNVDFGHTDPMISIPYGATIRLDSNINSFEFI
jgi:muramoyltetrapeptide carboxypeptidase LdcA involved in peptidoglycan recycling